MRVLGRHHALVVALMIGGIALVAAYSTEWSEPGSADDSVEPSIVHPIVPIALHLARARPADADGDSANDGGGPSSEEASRASASPGRSGKGGAGGMDEGGGGQEVRLVE